MSGWLKRSYSNAIMAGHRWSEIDNDVAVRSGAAESLLTLPARTNSRRSAPEVTTYSWVTSAAMQYPKCADELDGSAHSSARRATQRRPLLTLLIVKGRTQLSRWIDAHKRGYKHRTPQQISRTEVLCFMWSVDTVLDFWSRGAYKSARHDYCNQKITRYVRRDGPL